MAINAGGITAFLDLDTKKFVAGMAAADTQMGGFQGKMQAVSGKLMGVGAAMTAGLTIPILAVATAALKLGMDFEASMSEVQAISGATGEQMQKMETLARDMGATTKFSASEAAEGLKYMAMAGWDTEQMAAALPGVLDLAAASGSELGTVSDIVTDALTAFGLEAKDASSFADLLASASSNSNTNVEMLGESFKFVAPLMGALGATTDDTALALGLMANAGIKGGMAGTQLRGAITNLINPAKEAATVMNELGINAEYTTEGNLDLGGTLVSLREKFKNLTPEQQAQAASSIFGKQAMSGMLAIINASDADYNKLTENTHNYTGAAKEMAEIMQDNLQGAITVIKSGLEEAGLTIAERLVPSMKKLADFIQNLVTKFNELDDGTKDIIVKIGLLMAAIGPLMVLIGAILTPMGLMAVGLVAIGVAAIDLVKYFSQDVLPVFEEFGDDVSESAATAVTAFQLLEKDAVTSLKQLSLSSGEVTTELKDTILTNTNEMVNGVVTELERQRDESVEILREQLKNRTDISEEEKEAIIKSVIEGYDEQIKETEAGGQRIADILELASKEKRGLTKEENNAIIGLIAEMKTDTINLVSGSAEEQKAIYDNLKKNNVRVTIEMASDIIKESLKTKEETIANANEQHNKVVKAAEALRREGSAESIALADKMVAESERQRDQTIANAAIMHRDIVAEVKEQGKDIKKYINEDTGEVLTTWEVFCNDTNRLWDETMADLGKALKDTLPNMWADFQSWGKNLDGFFDGLTKKAYAWGSNIVYGLTNGILGTSSAKEAIANTGAGIKRQFEQTMAIQSPSKVFWDYGMNLVEGLALGIKENASKAEKAIADMAQGLLKEMDKLGNVIIGALKDRYREEERIAKESHQKQYDAWAEQSNKRIEGYDKEFEAKLRVLGAETSEEMKALQAQIDAIRNKTKQEAKELKEQEYNNRILNKEKEISELQSSTESIRIQKEMNELKASRDIELTDLQKDLIDDKTLNERTKLLEQLFDNKMSALEKETISNSNADEISRIENSKRKLTKDRDEQLLKLQNELARDKTDYDKDRLDEQEYNTKMSNLEKELLATDNGDAILKIQGEIDSMKSDKAREHELEEREAQIDDLRTQMDNVQENHKKEIEEQTKLHKAKLDQEDTFMKAAKDALDVQMGNTMDHYKELNKEENIQAEARRLALAENNVELVQLLEEFAPYWQDAGQTFGEQLLYGLNSMKGSIQSAVSEILGMVGRAESAASQVQSAVARAGQSYAGSLDGSGFDDSSLTPSQQREIASHKNNYDIAKSMGNTAIMNSSHAAAEEIRKNAKKYAHGTTFHAGGMAWVGEQGRELVNLPKGSQVHSNQSSERMVGESGTTIQNLNITIPAKDILEFKDVTDFFKNIGQVAKAGVSIG